MSRRFFVAGLAGLLLLLPTAGDALFVLHSSNLRVSPLDAAAFMTATFLAIVAELKPTRFQIGAETTEVTLSTAIGLPLLLIAGWPFALLLLTFAVATADIQLGKPWYKVVYNSGNYSFSVWAAGNVYNSLRSLIPMDQAAGLLSAGLAAAATFSFINTLLVVFTVAAAQNLPFRAVFLPYVRAAAPFFGGLTSLSVAAAVLWRLHPAAAVLLLPALVTARLAYNHFVRLRSETDNFVQSLADAVDLRDPYTAQHSVRVAELSRALGERLRLPTDVLWSLYSVARVHDVGKVTVPDSVLLKSGPLSPEEYDVMKGHVEAGVRILQHISLYRSALDILAQHHERLDGSGYPQGLRGDEIIFPARILAVADAYDAMTTDRPYRRAKTPEEAVRELYRVAGKEYDLTVVRALEDELIARGVLKGPVIPAALEAASAASPAQEETDAAARTARVVPLPRVGSGRKPS